MRNTDTRIEGGRTTYDATVDVRYELHSFDPDGGSWVTAPMPEKAWSREDAENMVGFAIETAPGLATRSFRAVEIRVNTTTTNFAPISAGGA